MKAENIKGKFEVIESFAIRKRNEFYMIGKIIQGDNETINNLLGLKIGNKCVNVTIEGED